MASASRHKNGDFSVCSIVSFFKSASSAPFTKFSFYNTPLWIRLFFSIRIPSLADCQTTSFGRSLYHSFPSLATGSQIPAFPRDLSTRLSQEAVKMTSRDYPTASSTPKLPPGLAGQSGVHQYSPVRSNSNRPAWDSEVSLSNYSTTAPPPRSSLGAQDSNYSLEKGQYASLGYGAASDSSAQLHPSPRPAPTRPSAKKAWSTRRKLLIGAVVAILGEFYA